MPPLKRAVFPARNFLHHKALDSNLILLLLTLTFQSYSAQIFKILSLCNVARACSLICFDMISTAYLKFSDGWPSAQRTIVMSLSLSPLMFSDG